MDPIILDIVVETPKGSRVKYEWEERPWPSSGFLKCSRVLHTPYTYFFNYGFVPGTKSPDGDPLDAVILMEEPLMPMTHIQCMVLGCLDTSDEEGHDPKLIVRPIDKIDPSVVAWKSLVDVPEITVDRIRHFFMHYKDLEAGKMVVVGNFYDWSEIFVSTVIENAYMAVALEVD
jgi:inorganic pyrophosphatase